MKYADGRAFRAALEARLSETALASGIPLVRLRKTVAFDRFLARLDAGAPGVWVLKGGLALQVRLHERARTTKDVDLHVRETADAATELLISCALTDLGDYFRFAVARPTTQKGQMRCGVEARLDGRIFELFHVDIAIGEALIGETELARVTSLLAFAGIPPVEFPCFPIEQHVAQKVHALMRQRGDRVNSRAKDLADLVLIGETTPLDAGRLRLAMAMTFAAGGEAVLPARIVAPAREWRVVYRETARDLGLSAKSVEEGIVRAGTLVDPVLGGLGVGTWNPGTLRWECWGMTE